VAITYLRFSLCLQQASELLNPSFFFEHELEHFMQFFSAWLVVAIIWLWCTFLVAGFFPIIDGRQQLYAIYTSLRYGKHGNSGDVDETARNSFEHSKKDDVE
jgi:hypothetical protein